MTRLANKLRERVQIRRLDQVPNDYGGYTEEWTIMDTVWMGIKPLSTTLRIIGGKHQPIARVEMSGSSMTHEFTVRRVAVQGLGKEYGSGFGESFDESGNYHPLQGNFFLFMIREGSTSKGRLFRIGQTIDNDERREYIKILAEEIEEQGSGDYPIL